MSYFHAHITAPPDLMATISLERSNSSQLPQTHVQTAGVDTNHSRKLRLTAKRQDTPLNNYTYKKEHIDIDTGLLLIFSFKGSHRF